MNFEIIFLIFAVADGDTGTAIIIPEYTTDEETVMKELENGEDEILFIRSGR